MTARAPLLGSTIIWALGLTFLHTNKTTTSAMVGLGLRRPRVVDPADADRTCRLSRYSVVSITVSFLTRSLRYDPAIRIYSERDKLFLKLRVNAATFSVN